MPNTYTDEKENIIKDRIQCWREIEIDHKKLKVSAISYRYAESLVGNKHDNETHTVISQKHNFRSL